MTGWVGVTVGDRALSYIKGGDSDHHREKFGTNGVTETNPG